MKEIGSLIVDAVISDLSRMEDECQAMRLALLAVLGLVEDNPGLPEQFREYLLLHFPPLASQWKNHKAPFSEGFSVMQGLDAQGHARVFFSEDSIRSLVPD